MQQKPVRPRKERSENAARRRKQIVDATLESISRHGLSGTTLATVAALAEMSQGSTIFYFQTKEQLFTEAFRAHCEEYRDAWRSVFDADFDDPVSHLAAFVLVDFSPNLCNRREISLWFDFWGESQTRPPFRQISDEHARDHADHLAALVERAAERMSPDWTPATFAKAIDAMSDGLWLEFHTQEGEVERHAARQLLVRFMASAFPEDRRAILAMAE
ncbi:MAG: TetR family transcriptional regulator C-terminal domain-containing protein [Woeseiaceae bacterium]|nr:TetR family transcriptional regulator C-terminal domain-containing protein [Woeseiaceae bacterium]